jgi:hypothetical protein
VALLGLIQTHAILHQAHRERDDRGRVVATLDDYAAVYELTADLVAAGVGASVSPTVREVPERSNRAGLEIRSPPSRWDCSDFFVVPNHL